MLVSDNDKSSPEKCARKYLFVTADIKLPTQRRAPKRDDHARRRFVQQGKRHAYPEIIFQPSRRGVKRRLTGWSSASERDSTSEHYGPSSGHRVGTLNPASSSPTGRMGLAGRNALPDLPPSSSKVSSIPRSCSGQAASFLIELCPEVLELIQYYGTVYHPSIWYAETRATRSQAVRRRQEGEMLVRDALHDRTYIYALLTAAASRLENVNRCQRSRSDSLMTSALQGVRMRLHHQSARECTSDDALIQMMIFLAAAEGYALRLDAASVHVRAVAVLVNRRGGMEALQSSSLRDMIAKVIISVQSAVFEACPIDVSSYFESTSEQYTPALMQYLADVANAASAPLTVRSALGSCCAGNQNFQHLIHGLAFCEKVLRASSTSVKPFPEDLPRWLFCQDLILRHQLLEMKLLDPTLQILRMTLLIWLTVVLTTLGQTEVSARMAGTLHQTITMRLRGEWAASSSLKGWTLSLGAMCADPTSVSGRWYMAELRHMLLLNGCHRHATFERLERLQEQFLYFPVGQETMLSNLASRLCEI
jgi:hypothetical protein